MINKHMGYVQSHPDYTELHMISIIPSKQEMAVS